MPSCLFPCFLGLILVEGKPCLQFSHWGKHFETIVPLIGGEKTWSAGCRHSYCRCCIPWSPVYHSTQHQSSRITGKILGVLEGYKGTVSRILPLLLRTSAEPVPTATPRVLFCSLFPRCARELERACLGRSVHVPPMKHRFEVNRCHPVALALCYTGSPSTFFCPQRWRRR